MLKLSDMFIPSQRSSSALLKKRAMAFGMGIFINTYFLVLTLPFDHFALSVWRCLKFLV